MICLLCQPSDGWGMMQDVASLCGCLAAVSVQAIYRRTGGLPIVATHIGNARRQEAVPWRREWGGHRLGKSRVVNPITHLCGRAANPSAVGSLVSSRALSTALLEGRYYWKRRGGFGPASLHSSNLSSSRPPRHRAVAVSVLRHRGQDMVAST